MTEKDHLIWTNQNLDFDAWKDWLQEEYPELTEAQQMELMDEVNYSHLEDERMNLNIQLDKSILVIADLGLWYGRRMGYKEIQTGNIRDCLYSDADYNTWYVDKRGDLCCDAVHHDGTDHYLYRVYKDNATEAQIDRLKEKLYSGRATRADITKITRRLGDDIAKVYGFRLPKERTRQELSR